MKNFVHGRKTKMNDIGTRNQNRKYHSRKCLLKIIFYISGCPGTKGDSRLWNNTRKCGQGHHDPEPAVQARSTVQTHCRSHETSG